MEKGGRRRKVFSERSLHFITIRGAVRWHNLEFRGKYVGSRARSTCTFFLRVPGGGLLSHVVPCVRSPVFRGSIGSAPAHTARKRKPTPDRTVPRRVPLSKQTRPPRSPSRRSRGFIPTPPSPPLARGPPPAQVVENAVATYSVPSTGTERQRGPRATLPSGEPPPPAVR